MDGLVLHEIILTYVLTASQKMSKAGKLVLIDSNIYLSFIYLLFYFIISSPELISILHKWTK